MIIFPGKTLVFEIWPNFGFRGASKRDFSTFGQFFSFPVYFGAMVTLRLWRCAIRVISWKKLLVDIFPQF